MAAEEKIEEIIPSGTDAAAGEPSETDRADRQASAQMPEQTPEQTSIPEQTSAQIQSHTAPQIQEQSPSPAADAGQDVQEKETARPSYDEAFEELYTEILNHFRSFSPSEQVAGQITEEHITEYLEGTREERMLAFKERREKRFLTMLEILGALTAIVLIVWFLKDNPAILVNILYLIGGLGIFFIWKQPHKKE